MKIVTIVCILSALLQLNNSEIVKLPGENNKSKETIKKPEQTNTTKSGEESPEQSDKSDEPNEKQQNEPPTKKEGQSGSESENESRDPLENCTTTLKQSYPTKYYRTTRATIIRNTTFIPKITYKVCLLNPDKGPCRANLNMFYFDPKYKKCKNFKWGGCQGNGNRFDTEKECLNYCLSKRNTKRKPPSFCQLKFDYGYCFGSTGRWYYDPVWSVCKETLYSGCGGNKNNFYTKEKCQDVCLFGKPLPKYSRDVTKFRYLIINPIDAANKRIKQ